MKIIGASVFSSVLFVSSLSHTEAFAQNKSGNHSHEKASSPHHMSSRTQSFYNSDPSLSNQFISKTQQQQFPEQQQPSKLIALRDPRGIITGFTTDPSVGDFPIDPSMNPGGQMTLSRPMSSYQTVNVPFDPNQMMQQQQQQQQMSGNMQQGDPSYFNNPQMMGGYMGGYGMGYYNDWYMPNTVQGYDEYGNTVITDRRFDVYGNVRNYGGWGGWGMW